MNGDGQVRRVDGRIVGGLYAAGNAMGAFVGPGYPGPGVTIAVALTWGFLAGRHAAQQRSASTPPPYAAEQTPRS